MSAVDLIIKKRNGKALSTGEIQAFVDGVSDDSWPDYQISAMLMAMFLKGLDTRETSDLTLAMASSGVQLDLSAVPGTKVDKHSTGGVADTTTLIAIPLVAACGVPVVKMSGRGLGFTGGTIDKLESIPGFQTAITAEQAIAQSVRIGCAIMGQTENLTPADKKLYALRDVTGTIDSIPLIAASIMSKKIAAGADAIVLDVKCGSGAFMPDLASARALAHQMVDIGEHVGRKVIAVLSGMEQPLGNLIGNSLEVLEAIDVLQGRTTGDLLDVALTLGSEMLQLGGLAKSDSDARQLLKVTLASGAAVEKFKELIAAQGGDPQVVDEPSRLPQATLRRTVVSTHNGWLAAMQTQDLGRALILLGGGREHKGDALDLSSGLILHKRLSQAVQAGEVLVELLGNNADKLEQAVTLVTAALVISPEKPVFAGGLDKPPVIYEIYRGQS
ncbi:MAG: thymidine phosphorylase [Eubacteriales bacterium]|nr:thymidine phosphorylase [Eubacteriales bacterium]